MTTDIIEMMPVPDIYADDVAMVEILGPNVRLTYFTWQDGQRIVVCKLVRPRDSVKGTVRQMLDVAEKAVLENVVGLH